MLKTVLSKTGHLLAELYDLMHVYSGEKTPIYLFYHGETSKLLYYGYLFEEKDLWDRAFNTLIGRDSDDEVRELFRGLEKINVYRWDRIRRFLRKKSNELYRLYSVKEKEIHTMIKKILGIDRFFEEIYVVFAFNPLNSLIGSLPVYSDEYAVATLFIGPGSTAEKILDLLIHELQHGLIRINDLDIPEDIEEEFIDTLCPEGYLSRVLGLSNEINVEESNLSVLIDKYFSEKLYEKMNLIEYIKQQRNGNYLL